MGIYTAGREQAQFLLFSEQKELISQLHILLMVVDMTQN